MKASHRQAHRDTVQPGIERRSSLKALDRSPSFQESFLGEIPSIILIAQNTVDHGEDLGAVLAYQFAERFSISSLRPTRQFQVLGSLRGFNAYFLPQLDERC